MVPGRAGTVFFHHKSEVYLPLGLAMPLCKSDCLPYARQSGSMRKFSTDTLALAEQNINTFSKTFFIGLTVHKPPFLTPFPFPFHSLRLRQAVKLPNRHPIGQLYRGNQPSSNYWNFIDQIASSTSLAGNGEI